MDYLTGKGWFYALLYVLGSLSLDTGSSKLMAVFKLFHPQASKA